MSNQKSNLENRVLLQKLFEVTQKLHSYVHSVDINTDQNAVLNITRFINERENIIKQWNNDDVKWIPSDKETMQTVKKLNDEAEVKLKEIYNFLGRKIHNIQKGKQLNHSYQQSYYNGRGTDGYYFDTRK